MDKKSKLELVNMIVREGALEILECARDRQPKHFKEFRNLVNQRTGRKFSPKTILDRTKELVELGALKKVIIHSRQGRDVIGYQITEIGIEVLEIALEFEKRLNEILKK